MGDRRCHGTAVYQGAPESNGGRCASMASIPTVSASSSTSSPASARWRSSAHRHHQALNGSHQLKVYWVRAGRRRQLLNRLRRHDLGRQPRLLHGYAIGPGSPGAERRGPAGEQVTDASDQAKLSARWQSTEKPTRTSSYGQADRVTGRLTTSTGQPISGALLDVTATPADQGAKSASLASCGTGTERAHGR